MLGLGIYILTMLIGINLIILVGIRRENKKKMDKFDEALKALRVIAISKGRHL